MEKYGFIMLRHVNSETTDKYWKFSYDKIRQKYPEFPIVIIDDNSNQQFLTQKELYKTTIVDSEFPEEENYFHIIIILEINILKMR